MWERKICACTKSQIFTDENHAKTACIETLRKHAEIAQKQKNACNLLNVHSDRHTVCQKKVGELKKFDHSRIR